MKYRSYRLFPVRVSTVLAFAALASAFLVAAVGCQQAPPEKDDQTGQAAEPDDHPVTIVVVNDHKDMFADFEAEIKREFSALELGAATFQHQSVTDFLAEPASGDLVLYPPWLFGEMIRKKLVREIPEYVINSEAFQNSDILRSQRRIFGQHQKSRYAISLGIPGYLLLVRKDILEKLGLSIPATWTEYEQLCHKLGELKDAGQLEGLVNSDRFSPAVEPLQGNWGATTMMARSGGYIRTRGRYSLLFDYSTWEPLIDQPPFVRALEELKKISDCMHPDHRNLDPAQVEQAFLNRECVLALTWPHPDQHSETDFADRIHAGFAPIPGTRSKFSFQESKWVPSKPEEQQVPIRGVSGFCCSVLSSSKQSGIAVRRLGLIGGREYSGQFVRANRISGFPFRASHLDRIEDWISPKYDAASAQGLVDVLESQDSATLWMIRPRVEKSLDYESALATGITDALATKDPEVALRDVKQIWTEINKSVDPEFQKQISLESLGVR